MKSSIIPLHEISLAEEFEKIRIWREETIARQLEEKGRRGFASKLYHKVFWAIVIWASRQKGSLRGFQTNFYKKEFEH